jgi:hypothetical protein
MRIDPHAPRRAPVLSLLAALSSIVIGCDAGEDPFARAAQAEAAGKLAEAAPLYGEVCAKNAASPLCPIATKRAERIRVKEAWKLVDDGQFAKAKELLTAAAGSADASVKRVVEAALKDPELVEGLRWDEANTAEDKRAARITMEALAELQVSVAPKAREWLAKNRPAQLLAEAKAACKADGQGSCFEVGKRLASIPAESPERAQAQALVDADYERVYPILKKADNLLVQRVEVFDKQAKYDVCVQEFMPAPGGVAQHACAGNLGVEAREDSTFPIGAIVSHWEKRLQEIHDPGLVKALQDRWARADKNGEYDPEVWPKPPGAKK